MIENTFKTTNEQYKSGCIIDEYNGTYGIAAAQIGADGKQYIRWMYPQKDRKPSEKSIPVKITLGKIDDAVEILRSWLDTLEGMQGKTEAPDVAEESIPF